MHPPAVPVLMIQHEEKPAHSQQDHDYQNGRKKKRIAERRSETHVIAGAQTAGQALADSMASNRTSTRRNCCLLFMINSGKPCAAPRPVGFFFNSECTQTMKSLPVTDEFFS